MGFRGSCVAGALRTLPCASDSFLRRPVLCGRCELRGEGFSLVLLRTEFAVENASATGTADSLSCPDPQPRTRREVVRKQVRFSAKGWDAALRLVSLKTGNHAKVNRPPDFKW